MRAAEGRLVWLGRSPSPAMQLANQPPSKLLSKMVTAWATLCIQHTVSNAASTSSCVLSIASLFLTSVRRPHVVALVDRLARISVGAQLEALGARIISVDEVSVRADAAALRLPTWATPARISNRNVTIPRQILGLYKMQVWNLMEYDEIVYFDSDVLFLRDASALMTHSPSFAAIRLRRIGSMPVCGGKPYMNAGVMKLRPSLDAYDALRATLRDSTYNDCGGEPLTDQDVVRELAFSTTVLGRFHEWPLCFNYRGWPNQRHCLRGEGPMLSHQERKLWPANVRAADGRRIAVSEIYETVVFEAGPVRWPGPPPSPPPSLQIPGVLA